MRMYAQSGVDYDVLDRTKQIAGQAAAETASALVHHGAMEVAASRGQSAYVFRVGDQTLAFVLECLGTKSLITIDHQRRTGENRWADIAIDTVCTVVNDVITVGALPMVINAYFATGSMDLHTLPNAIEELVKGWQKACLDSDAAWGSGETPNLAQLISPGAIDLAGSTIARVPSGIEPLLGDKISAGDEIVLIASSGIHANGISLARKMAGELAGGYAHQLPNGRSLSDSLLDPTVNYVGLVRELLHARIPVSYLVNITGHAWRKIMRADRELQYVITQLPEVPDVLTELVRLLGMDHYEAYGTLNMGAGFAVMCQRGHGEDVVQLASENGYRALVAGEVREGPRSVVIEPLDIAYESSSLQLK